MTSWIGPSGGGFSGIRDSYPKSARPHLVGAATGAGDHVLDAFHVGALEHGADELEFAGARLAVALGHRPDRAVVLHDVEHAPLDLLPAREVAVLVEDAGELGHL